MLAETMQSVTIHFWGGLKQESGVFSRVSFTSSNPHRLSYGRCRPRQLMTVAVSENAAPPVRRGRPPLSNEFIAPRSRKGYRVVSDSLVEETLQMLPPVSPDEGKLRKAIDVIHFLLSLWMTKKNLQQVVERFPTILSCDVGELEKRASYFLDGGCSAGEVGNAAVRTPQLLTTPMDRFKSMALFLQKTGISEEKIPKILLKSPGVLDLDFTQSVNPLITSLEEIAPTFSSVERMIETHPKVLQLSKYDIADRTAVMRSFGLTFEAISNLCVKKAGVLLIEPEVLRDRFLNLQTIFSERRLPNIFKVAPSLLVVTPEKVNKKYELLTDYLGEDTARKVVNAFPQALSLSWKKVLLPKFEYLIELGLDPSEVVNFPAYLGYSLDDRIRSRCELLLQEGFKIDAHSQVVKSENEKKLRKHGRSHRAILDEVGSHSVCIQHIVGQKDQDFEEQFGVVLSRVSTGNPLPLYEFDESDMDELEQLEQEAGLGDMDDNEL